MTDLRDSPLGRSSATPERYDPAILFPVDRAEARAAIGVTGALPFLGHDAWTAWECAWLDATGRPHVAVARIDVPATSPRIVESKSVKLYLTALNQTRFAAASEVGAAIAQDLSHATGAKVAVTLTLPRDFGSLPHGELGGECLDELPLGAENGALSPELLGAAGPIVEESVYSRLFRSVCPVTGQPDYASVQLAYRGARIDRGGLLRYLVSYRRHPGFHEHCVERIFTDVWRRCRPEALSVHARFTRRGGIDINPYRTSGDEPPPPNTRTARQ